MIQLRARYESQSEGDGGIYKTEQGDKKWRYRERSFATLYVPVPIRSLKLRNVGVG
jgi:hypothetical protein